MEKTVLKIPLMGCEMLKGSDGCVVETKVTWIVSVVIVPSDSVWVVLPGRQRTILGRNHQAGTGRGLQLMRIAMMLQIIQLTNWYRNSPTQVLVTHVISSYPIIDAFNIFTHKDIMSFYIQRDSGWYHITLFFRYVDEHPLMTQSPIVLTLPATVL